MQDADAEVEAVQHSIPGEQGAKQQKPEKVQIHG
jgi:hypothetical protein